MSCARCKSDAPIVASVEMRMPQLVATSLYCAPCSGKILAAVFERELDDGELIIWSAFDPNVDVAEHHPACRCHECDPDFRFELEREERLAC